MKLLWNGDWIEVPAPTPVPGAVALTVQATIPIERVPMPRGRVIRAPHRKALRFLALDGPASTLRKARSKREEARLQDDYRIVAVLGRRDDADSETADVLALAPRAAPCAEILLCHEDLVVAKPAASVDDLRRFAAVLARERDAVTGLATQSFLYSGQRPPDALRVLAQAAADDGADSTPSPEREVLRAPSAAADADAAETVLRLREPRRDDLPVALLGAGDYARTQIIPALRRTRLRPYALADREPQIAAEVARASGFALATTDAQTAIESLPATGLVVVATGHDSHAELAASALDAGHRVFVEKPAVVTDRDLELLENAAQRAPGRLDVGFNRRHHPLTARLRSAVEAEDGPLTITCVVRQISISPNHWYFWPNQGTRVAGNLCHWLDFGISLLHPRTKAVAVTVPPPIPKADRDSAFDVERTLTVAFDDGSVINLIATDRGDDLLGVQESIDVRRGLVTATIDDYRSISVSRNGRVRRFRRAWRTKGHRQMFQSCFERAAMGEPTSYPLDDLWRVSRIQLAAADMVAKGGTRQLADSSRSSELQTS